MWTLRRSQPLEEAGRVESRDPGQASSCQESDEHQVGKGGCQSRAATEDGVPAIPAHVVADVPLGYTPCRPASIAAASSLTWAETLRHLID